MPAAHRVPADPVPVNDDIFFSHTAMKKVRNRYMLEALRLARRGLGLTSPNPPVGCVIVKSGKVIGRGYHRAAGLPHAEVEALGSCRTDPKGSDMYVTLEPCNHHGRTPPCTDAIIGAGIKRVFVGMKDPNPLVSGRGIKRLRASGIEVVTGMLEERCRALLEPYTTFVTRKRPFVTLKLATSLDGRIATPAGESKWITGEDSRRLVHRMRSQADCVMVGVGTVLEDDPELTVRMVKGRTPVRAVVDSTLKIPLKARLFKEGPGPLIFTTRRSSLSKREKVREKGGEVLLVPSSKDGVDLERVMDELYRRGIVWVLMEGGGRLAASALRAGIVDRVFFFVSPILLGGDSRPSVGDLCVRRLADAPAVEDIRIRRLVKDILIEGCIKGRLRTL